jgi:hypothetical protein
MPEVDEPFAGVAIWIKPPTMIIEHAGSKGSGREQCGAWLGRNINPYMSTLHDPRVAHHQVAPVA